jgi:cyanophycinase
MGNNALWFSSSNGYLLSNSSTGPCGSLALIGGRFESDNDELFKALKARCNGRIAVLSMASGYPEEVGRELVEDFQHHGFETELLPLFWENREASAFDPTILQKLAHYQSVFFSGGNQARIVETLVQGGAETPALACIRRCHAAGGLVAGTSAGAAIMSGPMILGGTSLNAVASGQSDDPEDEDGFRLGSGLGFFRWGLVDQHFLQRGRIGRLLMAAKALGEPLAFGVDENSGLLVDGDRATVVGETGVLFIDLRKADFDVDDYLVSGARVSYLDDGDGFDLTRGKPLPAPDKRRVRVNRASFRRPAPVRRHAFASYAIHDLLLRLVEGDTAYYRSDSASAYDADTQTQITVELQRRPRRSRALRAVRDGEIRYSAMRFELALRSTRLPLSQRPPESTVVLPPDPAPEARLVLLGNSPLTWSEPQQAALETELRQPVGILATASGEPRKVAASYLEWLRGRGIKAEILDVSLSNIERAGRDRRLLKRIGTVGSLLLTGGDQRRLTETLLHCADATPVLAAIVGAYEKGTPLIGVAAAASAFASHMIADGDSEAALRHGSSEDAGFSGVVVEQGIGLTRCGLIDQNFLQRQRLGRLLVACASRGEQLGFGLCEESGLVITGQGDKMEVIGRDGVIIARFDPAGVALSPPDLDTRGISLFYMESGQQFDVSTLAERTPERATAGLGLLEQAIADLARTYNAALEPGHRPIDTSSLRNTLLGETRRH